MSFVNVTNDTSTENKFSPHDYDIWMYLPPIMIIIGVFQSILSLVILSRKQFHDLPVFMTLIALSVNDILVLFIGPGRYFVSRTFQTVINEWSPFACTLFSFLTLSHSHISSMLVALLSVERVVAVCEVMRSPKPTIDRYGMPILIIVCYLLNIPSAYFPILKKNEKFLSKGNFSVDPGPPGIHQPKHTYVCTIEYQESANLIDIIDMCLLAYVPFTIILICNIKIILVVNRQARKFRGKKSEDKGNQAARIARKRDSRVTNMLLGVTFMFLICNFPFAAVHVARTVGEQHWNNVVNILWVLTYNLAYVNNCVNFVIYSVSQPPFRNELKRIMCNFGKREPAMSQTERMISGCTVDRNVTTCITPFVGGSFKAARNVASEYKSQSDLIKENRENSQEENLNNGPTRLLETDFET